MAQLAINQDIKDDLDKLRTHPRDTYGLVIGRLVSEHKEKLLKDQASRPVETPNVDVVED